MYVHSSIFKYSQCTQMRMHRYKRMKSLFTHKRRSKWYGLKSANFMHFTGIDVKILSVLSLQLSFILFNFFNETEQTLWYVFPNFPRNRKGIYMSYWYGIMFLLNIEGTSRIRKLWICQTEGRYCNQLIWPNRKYEMTENLNA